MYSYKNSAFKLNENVEACKWMQYNETIKNGCTSIDGHLDTSTVTELFFQIILIWWDKLLKQTVYNDNDTMIFMKIFFNLIILVLNTQTSESKSELVTEN